MDAITELQDQITLLKGRINRMDERVNRGKALEGAGKIYASMSKAMGEVGAVAKDAKNKQQGWDYRRVEKIYEACQKAMSKNIISLWYEPLETKCEAVSSKSGARGFHVVSKYMFKFSAEDGSHDILITYGEAIDWGDKAHGKALTYAMKNALIAAFCIPTELSDDPDAEAHQPFDEKHSEVEKAPRNNDPNKKITQSQLKRLYAIIGEQQIAPNMVKEYCFKNFNIESSKDLNRAQYDQLVNVVLKCGGAEGFQKELDK